MKILTFEASGDLIESGIVLALWASLHQRELKVLQEGARTLSKIRNVP